MIQTLLPFLILMLSGSFWKKIPGVPPELDARAIRAPFAAVVLHLFLPALAFQVLYTAPLQGALRAELWQVPLVSIAVCLTLAGIAWVLYDRLRVQDWRRRHRRPERDERAAIGAMLLAAAWCNCTYLGLPVVSALFGSEYRRIPLLFDMLALTPLLLTVGTAIGVGYGHAAAASTTATPAMALRANLSAGIRRSLKLPPLWAAGAGLVLNLMEVELPAAVLTFCALCAAAVAPMMIFAVGLALDLRGLKELRHRVGWWLPALLLKMIVSPVLAAFLLHSLELGGVQKNVVLIEAAMPTMVLTLAISDRFGLDSELLSQVIALTTLATFLTLPWVERFLFWPA